MELHPSLRGKRLERLQCAQQIMTCMFKEFDSLCRKHDIKYWAIGGTLIGTVRKDKLSETGKNVGGWIPFDGDVDIAMMKTDYEKFKIVAYELPSTMFLQNKQNDHRYLDSNCVKLRDKNSHYLSYTPAYAHHGLQIDIFLWDKFNEYVYYKQLSKNRYEEIYHRNVIFPLKEMDFEGFQIYVPNKYDEYCKINFGTWPLPYLPIEKRLPHEGDVCPDKPHPNDIVWYPHLYTNFK